MADLAPNRASGSAGPGAGSQNGDLAKLRELLFGRERQELDQLQERIRDLDQRARDVAEVLAKAIDLRSTDAKLRKSLAPILEGAITTSVQRRPRALAKALSPTILAAVRRAVADALSDMSESLNQIVEKSVSLRGLLWRIEAIFTGKRFSDILLTRSLLYSVQQVFLIHNKTGLLLHHVVAPDATFRDPDLVSSMLTAIQDWVHDSFEGTEDQRIETVKLGNLKIWIQHGQYASVAAAIVGTPPVELRAKLRSSLERVEREMGPQLEKFSGDAEQFTASRPYLEACCLGKSSPKPRRYWIRWVAWATIALAAVGVWVYVGKQRTKRWENYLADLDSQPGIVVMRSEAREPGYRIYGLRDPLAKDPRQLLRDHGISDKLAILRFDPYLSPAPRFQARRQFVALKQQVEHRVLRFDSGASRLSEAQTIGGEQIASEVRALLDAAAAAGQQIRLEITGHTDELGSEQLNSRLSEDRAIEVSRFLVLQGVPSDLIATRGAATAEPVRKGATDREQTYNRSVTFRVVGASE